MTISIDTLSIQKACDLISGDMNLFLSHQQMVNLLSTHPALLEAVNDGGLVPVVQKHVFNHLSISLLSIPMPTVDDFDAMNETIFAPFFFHKIQAAGVERGYKYSTHPDGPDGEK